MKTCQNKTNGVTEKIHFYVSNQTNLTQLKSNYISWHPCSSLLGKLLSSPCLGPSYPGLKPNFCHLSCKRITNVWIKQFLVYKFSWDNDCFSLFFKTFNNKSSGLFRTCIKFKRESTNYNERLIPYHWKLAWPLRHIKAYKWLWINEQLDFINILRNWCLKIF